MKPSGKWDKQALTMFVFSAATLLTGIYIVISDYFLPREVNRYAIDVLIVFAALSTGSSIVNVVNKREDRKFFVSDSYPQDGAYHPDRNPNNIYNG
jgi:hypothetical protein